MKRFERRLVDKGEGECRGEYRLVEKAVWPVLQRTWRAKCAAMQYGAGGTRDENWRDGVRAVRKEDEDRLAACAGLGRNVKVCENERK